MAKTEKGKKIVEVKRHYRNVNGKRILVKEHRKSTPN